MSSATIQPWPSANLEAAALGLATGDMDAVDASLRQEAAELMAGDDEATKQRIAKRVANWLINPIRGRLKKRGIGIKDWEVPAWLVGFYAHSVETGHMSNHEALLALWHAEGCEQQ